MDVPPEFVSLGAQLAGATARNGAALVTDKVRALRKSGKQEEIISGLEQLVSELVDDKNEITRIAQAYQAELVSQRLAPGDLQYIADTVVPTLQKIADGMGSEKAEEFEKLANALRPLLSVETANVLQLLGFNFRDAIGQPLTTLMQKAILARAADTGVEKVESLKREQLYLQVALDPEAFDRLNALFGR
ncbi:hypothetical protein [Microbacterium murale]|uniref:Uncharacterized protein n=1 Tax=Microbacterium murale TaxID=1081040 RepID=A0ABQ1RWJ2_9MICO|nr:hypothetical protein [Microbacterium murale]GGD83181.1 hypothetical protein GCM10007269_27530 [Microbacterium murale]